MAAAALPLQTQKNMGEGEWKKSECIRGPEAGF
jgi:hypothetical protein